MSDGRATPDRAAIHKVVAGALEDLFSEESAAERDPDTTVSGFITDRIVEYLEATRS